MREDIKQRRQKRADFLARLYEMVDGSVSTFVSAFEIADAVGVDAAEAVRIIEYLKEKQWLHIDDHKLGIVRITAAGIDHVETTN